MFYIIGYHFRYGTILYVELCNRKPLPSAGAPVDCIVRPATSILFAEAFEAVNVNRVIGFMTINYPEYKWCEVEAKSEILIPENMRKTLNIA